MTPRFAWDPNPDNFATVSPAYRPCCRRCIKVSTTFNCNGQKYDEVDGRLFPEEYWHYSIIDSDRNENKGKKFSKYYWLPFVIIA